MTIRRRGTGKGAVFPHEKAGMLLNPLRRFVQSPETLARRLRLAPDSVVLELGCGPGYFTPTVARRVPQGRYVLFDLQAEMLAKARGRTASTGVRVDLVQGDAVALPFPDNTFDAAFTVTVLGEIPEREQVLAELARVLKPGGLYLNSETRGDPDFLSYAEVRRLAGTAGFTPLHRWGFRWLYTAAFRAPR